MRTRPSIAVAAACLVISISGADSAETLSSRLVVCAPNYPGTTESAQPTMDRFAELVARTAGLPSQSLRAEYDPTEDGGLSRLQEADAALALVPLPFFLAHAGELALEPLLIASRSSEPGHKWGLAARKGAVTGPADLDGWEITGTPGYAPAFVRGPLLGQWGQLPASARITSQSRLVRRLRAAAAGAPLAVVLDDGQMQSLGMLGLGEALEIVTRSEPLPEALLCTVGERFPADRRQPLVDGMLKLHEGVAAELLEVMRLERFLPIDEKTLAAVRESYARARD